jgi:hypothetical protein
MRETLEIATASRMQDIMEIRKKKHMFRDHIIFWDLFEKVFWGLSALRAPTVGPCAGYYAMGYHKVQAQNVKNATTLRWRCFLLRVQREDVVWFHRVVVVAGQMKEQWGEEHIFKMSYFDHIPAKWLGGFSQYLGYSKAEAKQCVRQCIAEAMFT